MEFNIVLKCFIGRNKNELFDIYLKSMLFVEVFLCFRLFLNFMNFYLHKANKCVVNV